MKTFHNTCTIPESVNADAPKGFKVCMRDADLWLKIEQQTNRKALFRVTYGLQVNDELTYEEACNKVGEAILHALCCNGQATNDGA